jgi:hypothetical protein
MRHITAPETFHMSDQLTRYHTLDPDQWSSSLTWHAMRSLDVKNVKKTIVDISFYTTLIGYRVIIINTRLHVSTVKPSSSGGSKFNSNVNWYPITWTGVTD